MTVIRKYKNWAAIILLALYGFICTPVFLWHQHQCNSNLLANLNSDVDGDEKDARVAFFNLAPKDNCLVCAHQYSSYLHDFIPEPQINTTVVSLKQGFYYLPTLCNICSNKTNKGPPVVA